MSGVYVKVAWPEDQAYVVHVDDDGKRVAYAYLKMDGRIVADVWLYNIGETPAEPEWKRPGARELLPFKNPRGFARDEDFAPIATEREVAMRWTRGPDGVVCADLSIRGRLHARLREGARPGECVLSARDGPIARVLT